MQLFIDGGEIQLEKLSEMGDPLLKINEIIDWEIFRPILMRVRKDDYSKGGRPPYDVVLMFKIVMLMSWYNLSYNSAEFIINDRLSFMRFLGVPVGTKLPDENTIWDFKEDIKNHELERELFDIFNQKLIDYGYSLKSGTMVDASFCETPKRRVISETSLKEPEKLLENEAINVTLEETETAVLVHADDDKTEHILRQTDFDARFAKKNDIIFFGYKDHVAVDKDTKFITAFEVTSAEVHDSRVCTQFITPETIGIWADSAYLTPEILAQLTKINPNIKINICNRAYRNKPLSDTQKQENHLISKIRARVEHVFGFMERSMCGMTLNCIGLERAKRDISLKNLGYNIKRFVTLSKPKKFQNA